MIMIQKYIDDYNVKKNEYATQIQSVQRTIESHTFKQAQWNNTDEVMLKDKREKLEKGIAHLD